MRSSGAAAAHTKRVASPLATPTPRRAQRRYMASEKMSGAFEHEQFENPPRAQFN
jgi:hypothetical protein